MSSVAPTLQAFFTDRLARQLQASPRTIASYRDTLRLLLARPRHDRQAALRARLGRSRRAADHRVPGSPRARPRQQHPHPQPAPDRDPLAVPLRRAAPSRARRRDRTRARDPAETPPETHRHLPHRGRGDRAHRRPRPDPLGRPARPRPDHRRLQAGLRVSELIGLNCADVVLGTGAHVRCHGKGRKQRAVPLTADAQAVLASWLANAPADPTTRCFPPAPADGSAATRSSNASQPTPLRPPLAARRWQPSRCTRTCSATAARCRCFTPASTPP